MFISSVSLNVAAEYLWTAGLYGLALLTCGTYFMQGLLHERLDSAWVQLSPDNLVQGRAWPDRRPSQILRSAFFWPCLIYEPLALV